MNFIRTLVALGFYLVATPVAALIAIPYTLVSRRIGFLYQVGMSIAAFGVRLAGVRVSSQGLDRLDPKGVYIFMANHVSNIDPPVLLPRIPKRTSVLVKKELFRLPILGLAMRMAQLVPVDRSQRERAVESLEQAAAVLRSGVSMSIFVEGTRSRDGRLLPFKKGPFFLAMDTGVPVVPVTISGTFAALPKGRFVVRSGQVRLLFHEPIEPARFPDREALLEAVRERIASALPPQADCCPKPA